MILTTKQELLLAFVKDKHGSQKRKYTGEPYWTHPYAVAEIINKHTDFIEVSLCHDLLEDTDCTSYELFLMLSTIGYPDNEAHGITTSVVGLTDIYTHEDYPELNRAYRKKKEAVRLGSESFCVQSVKYADLIHNTQSIITHDKDFSKVYLKEKDTLLHYMNDGNIQLYIECCTSLKNAVKINKNIT